MKDIEAGCQAMVVRGNSKNIGKVVIVGRFVGGMKKCDNTDLWEVNIPLYWASSCTEDHYKPFCPASALKRIDPPEASTWEAGTWQPSTDKVKI